MFCCLGAWISLTAGHSILLNQFPSAGFAFLPVAIAICWGASRGASLLSPKRWLWSLVLLVGWIFLEARAIFALRQVIQSPTHELIVHYAGRSLEFIVFVFVWTFLFPLRRGVAVESSAHRLYWNLGLFAACMVAGYFGIHATLGTQYWSEPSVDQLRTLQLLIARGVLMLYGLLVIRVFLPVTLSQIRSGSESHKIAVLPRS